MGIDLYKEIHTTVMVNCWNEKSEVVESLYKASLWKLNSSLKQGISLIVLNEKNYINKNSNKGVNMKMFTPLLFV